MKKRRRLPTASESARMAQKGILDDSILYLTDDELRQELTAYRDGVKPSDDFDAEFEIDDDRGVLSLHGDLDARALSKFQARITEMIAAKPKKVVVDMTNLDSLTADGIQAFVAARKKLDRDVEIVVVGATGDVQRAFDSEEPFDSTTVTWQARSH